eukprot:6464135-Amphidinium_carterae.1
MPVTWTVIVNLDMEVFAPWGQDKLQKLFKLFDKHNDRPPDGMSWQVCGHSLSCWKARRFDSSAWEEVHVDDVKNILKLLGISEEASCIEAILREQTRYSTLDWDEFVEFMKRFKAPRRICIRLESDPHKGSAADPRISYADQTHLTAWETHLP